MKRLVFGFIALIGLGGEQAEAAMITAVTVEGSFNAVKFKQPPTGVSFLLGVTSIQIDPLTGEVVHTAADVFDLLFLTPADVGATFRVDASTPGFSLFAAELTDGTPDSIRHAVIPDGLKANLELTTEAEYFGYDPDTDPRVDLTGFALDAVALWVDVLTIEPVTITGADGEPVTTGYDVRFVGVLAFEGEPVAATPAPAGLTLLGIGGAFSLLCYGLKRRKAGLIPTAAAA